MRVNVTRLLSPTGLSLCPISRNQPVEPEYSDVFIIKPPFQTPDYSDGGRRVTLRATGQVETPRRVLRSELCLFFFHISEPGNLAIVDSQEILGASRPDFR